MKYAWIKEHRDEFPVKAMCKVIQVSRSGYYKSLHSRPSQRALRSQRIREQVKQIHEQSHGTYGSYKISKAMKEAGDEDGELSQLRPEKKTRPRMWFRGPAPAEIEEELPKEGESFSPAAYNIHRWTKSKDP